MDEINKVAYDSEGDGARTLEALEEAVDYNRWVADIIRPYLGSTNLELGAGQGTISNFILDSHKVILTELAPDGLAHLKKRYADNENVLSYQSDFVQVTEKLDCIYSSNVIEHIEDDLSIISHADKVLNRGGTFFAFVPAGRWLFSEFDKVVGHFRRYDRSDVLRIQNHINVNNLDLEIERFEYSNPIGALGWYIKLVLMGVVEVNKKDALLFNKLVPFIKWLDFFFKFLFGQSAILVIRKK